MQSSLHRISSCLDNSTKEGMDMEMDTASRTDISDSECLKQQIDDLQDWTTQLESFEQSEAVNSHCDVLVARVRLVVESQMERLAKTEAELVKQIEAFREERLQAQSTETFRERVAASRREVETLCQTSKAFSLEWSATSQQHEMATMEEIEMALEKAQDLSLKASLFASKLEREAFDNYTMSFVESMTTLAARDLVGELVTSRKPNEIKYGTVEATVIPCYYLHGSETIVLVSDQLLINSDNNDIQLMNLVVEDEDYDDDDYEGDDDAASIDLDEPDVFRAHHGNINCMTLLANGRLASASRDKTIKIWDIDTKSLVQTIEINDKNIQTLRVLPNGHIASFSKDCSIKIWNPYTDANHLVSSIGPIDKCPRLDVNLSVLSNGFLVSDYWTEDDRGKKWQSSVSVWDPFNKKLVKNILTQNDNYISCVVALIGDRVAVGFVDGLIEIFDLMDESKAPLIIDTEDDKGVDDLAQLGNGLLVSAHHGLSAFKVWDPRDGRLVLMQKTCRMYLSTRLNVSHDGRCIIIGAPDSCVTQIWSLSA